jgi:hypothetical protein
MQAYSHKLGWRNMPTHPALDVRSSRALREVGG